MLSAHLFPICLLITSAYTAEVLLYSTSAVCRSGSITLRFNVQQGPGGPCVPIPGTELYTAGRLGVAGPDMRLKIFSYQGQDRCGGPVGEGAGADSCVTAVGHIRIISGVGVSTDNAHNEEAESMAPVLDAADDARIIGNKSE